VPFVKLTKAVYTWYYNRFQQQLVKMRHVRALKQRPNYSLHFRDEGTFTNPSPPTYAFTGTAKAPLRLLASQISHDVTVPIICPYTMEAIGSCRLAFSLSSSGSSGIASPESVTRPLKGTVPVGQRYSFDILLNGVKGISSSSFSSIHAQVRLSSLVGEDIASDDTFISPSVDLTKSSASHLSLRKTVTVIVTPAMVDHMKSGYANFEFFAVLRPQYLERLDRWDISREASNPLVQSPNAISRPAMRRCETDFLGEEHHDILATIDISELSSSGTYQAVEVIDDIYQLHQGVQRRLGIKLQHSSGKTFEWTSIDHVTIGDIRTKSKDQITTVSDQDINLTVTSGEVDHFPDGTSILSGSGPWDTAVHGSIHLDRRTRSEQTIIVRLVFLVNVESLHEPASFTLDLPLKVLARESRRSSLMTYFTSGKVYNSLTAIYGIDLVPPIAQSTQDLWRLDTAKKHVSGEEVLGDWRPRGVSLLDDWQRARKTAKGIADKQVTATVLDLLGDLNSVETSKDQEGLLRDSLNLWKTHMEQRYLVCRPPRSLDSANHQINLEPKEDEAISRKMRKLMPELETKLVPHVKLAPKVYVPLSS
jgi:kinesin family protein 1